VRLVSKKQYRQEKHDDRADEPVLREGQGQRLLIRKDHPYLAIVDFREGRIHHDDEAGRYGD